MTDGQKPGRLGVEAVRRRYGLLRFVEIIWSEAAVPGGLLLSAAFALVLVVDRSSKWLVIRRVGSGRVIGRGPLRLRCVATDGYGLRLVADWRALVALWLVAVVGCLLLALAGPTAELAATQIGLGAAIGGATSNLIDRLRQGATIDMLEVRGWSVFNLADVAIVVGATVTVSTFIGVLHGGQ